MPIANQDFTIPVDIGGIPESTAASVDGVENLENVGFIRTTR